MSFFCRYNKLCVLKWLFVVYLVGPNCVDRQRLMLLVCFRLVLRKKALRPATGSENTRGHDPLVMPNDKASSPQVDPPRKQARLGAAWRTSVFTSLPEEEETNFAKTLSSKQLLLGRT